MALINVNWDRTEIFNWIGEVEVPDDIFKQGRIAIKQYILETCIDELHDYGMDDCKNIITYERIDEDD